MHRLLPLSLLILLITPPASLWAQTASAQGKTVQPPSEESTSWDVQNPPGEWSSIDIDTDTGTWMSLDVSPDGSEIVFDLLGDLYTIPIQGGTARALTSGIAWDMQPTYSPDGRLLAFTSDRAGGNNVWVMERDGSNPRQVTKESFRLLNSPGWAPDGQFIAARKHFTSARSLGAGEIWLYHRTGGDGLQMTEKPNEQKDLGEPAFSPDGKYLYYSQDTTAGDIFQYNKDSNGQIYTIQRLDRESGRSERYVTGAGGAVRPTPSPDGRSLAFLRRVRARTVLHLMDLESGAVRPLYDGLDRDMQEAWAIHGVYPRMAWTPDSRSILFWAGGQIRRLHVEDGRLQTIPFRVKDTRAIAPAVRFSREIAPDSFDVKMLRWVSVSPQADRVIYQALGHLYVRDLPEGEPRRLTSQEDHYEYYPSFSRDGRQVVYVSWDDADLGAIRVVPVSGGSGRVLTEKPGHYVEPVFSPDGARVVYRRAGRGALTSPLWSKDPGIYSVPVTGGESRLVTTRGIRPTFGSASDRVFLMERKGDKTLLTSIELDGSDYREHLASEWATDFQVSPDQKWVAFNERFRAFIAPFVHTGQTISLGPKTSSIPLKEVTRESGEFLHWSGDSRSLHWSLGPTLYTRSITDLFPFLPGASPDPSPQAEGRKIGFRTDSNVPSGKLAIVGARIVTMRGDEVIRDGTILIEGNRITAVGPRSQVSVPDDAHRMEAAGLTAMPGIIDVHAHGPQGSNQMIPEQNWAHLAQLAFGVTTTHDPSHHTGTIFAASEMARAGLLTAPRIFSTGTILYGATTASTAQVDSLDDARFHLSRMKAVGAFSVKSYNQPRREQRQQILAAAREMEMLVLPEGGSLFMTNLSMVVDGHTGVEHNIPVAAVYDDTLQLWAASRVGYTPTMVVSYGGLSGEFYWYQHTDVWDNKRLLTFVPRERVDPRSRRRLMAPTEEYNHFNTARVSQQLSQAGVLVNLGAHGQRQGLAAHWELWMFVQGGMSPLQAIRAATLNGARYLGIDADLGSLEAGKLADLLLLEENPLEDIRNSETIRFTIANGRVYDARSMDQVGNHPGKRRALFWERETGPGRDE